MKGEELDDDDGTREYEVLDDDGGTWVHEVFDDDGGGTWVKEVCYDDDSGEGHEVWVFSLPKREDKRVE